MPYQNHLRRGAEIVGLPDDVARAPVDRTDAPSARNVNIAVVKDRIGLGQRQPFFIYAEFFAFLFLSRVGVVTGRAFVEKEQAAVEQKRRAVIVQGVCDLTEVFAETGGHHFDLAIELAFPELASVGQADYMYDRFPLEFSAGISTRILDENDGE